MAAQTLEYVENNVRVPKAGRQEVVQKILEVPVEARAPPVAPRGKNLILFP